MSFSVLRTQWALSLLEKLWLPGNYRAAVPLGRELDGRTDRDPGTVLGAVPESRDHVFLILHPQNILHRAWHLFTEPVKEDASSKEGRG